MAMPHWKEAEDVRGLWSPWCTVHVTVIVTDSEVMLYVSEGNATADRSWSAFRTRLPLFISARPGK
jgi:hypothetical protein